MRHTKIIATLGPVSSDPGTIDALVTAGADVFRFNFSHGTAAEHAARFRIVREAAARAGRQIAVLQDLSGPKIRTGKLRGGQPVPLTVGEPLVIEIGDGIGEPGHVYTSYAPLATALSAGDRLLLDDGHVELRVESVSAGKVTTSVVYGSALGEHKGINAPGVPLPAVGVTEKDERDLAFGLALGVDIVALSFVQTAADIATARAITTREGRPDVPIIAKLERPEALEHLDAILSAANGVMVARGDLGLEIPLQRVPRVQRDILRRARQRGVPTVLATQVLESMRTESRPTRAEVSDAATAVVQGADAIMLSGETASGNFPVRSVQMLDAIIREAELAEHEQHHGVAGPPDHAGALCDAAVTLSRKAGADAIIAVTREGRTPRLLSMRRPRAPIYAASDREDIARRLGQWWGTLPVVTSIEGDVDTVASSVIDQLRQSGRLAPGATVVVVNVTPDLDCGVANFLRVRRV
ncbi:MAG: pyruvate kinase [Acidobacteria bacterium]|nr:pyruvate kinase [Acidobacteriota bacterium]